MPRNGYSAAAAADSVVSTSPHHDALSRLKRAILRDYSYRDRRGVDWEQRFLLLGSGVESSRSSREFAQKAAELLSPAQDIHLWLQVGRLRLPTHRRDVPANIITSILPRVIPSWRQHNETVMSGKFRGGTFYLCLRGWPGSAPKRIAPAFQVVRRAASAGQAIVIDVRANGGGAEPLAARFAGCFVQRSVCYAKHLTARDGTWRGPIERWLKPNKTGPHYRGRVAVLIGPGTVSSCESFVLMMKQVPGCQLIGQRTAGASGNPRPVRSRQRCNPIRSKLAGSHSRRHLP